VVKNLQKIKKLASEGKMDAALEAAAAEIRSRFGK
jgi:soluble cytochrome b562